MPRRDSPRSAEPGPEEAVALARLLYRAVLRCKGLGDATTDDTLPAAHFESVLARFQARPTSHEAGALLDAVCERTLTHKERGSYFTSTDITGYLTRSSVLPFLLVAPEPSLAGLLTYLLATDPERYLFPAVCHGLAAPVPTSVEAGLQDIQQREPWNRRASSDCGLPDETWREYLARRERVEVSRERLAAGEICGLRELVQHNLDLPRLALDALALADAEALAAFWGRLESLTLLDPTCGAGAFLQAALHLLAPLYEACLERMTVLLAQPASVSGEIRRQFRSILARSRTVSSPRVFALRSILELNLYGVDLDPGVLEVACWRLRLDLAGAAGCDADLGVPGLARHLRCGNALLSESFDWTREFPEVTLRGGFDVVVGNPPYLELREVDYETRGFRTASTGAVHALCLEQGLDLLQPHGCLGMIVPLALVSTQRMRLVQELLEHERTCFYANFAWRPGKLFPGVNRALTTVVALPDEQPAVFTTGYRKWSSENREHLLPTLAYVRAPDERPDFWIPKLGHDLERDLLARVLRFPPLSEALVAESPHRVYYRTDGGLYWKVFTDFPPAFRVNGRKGHSTRETWICLAEACLILPVIAALSSSTFWWWYTVTSNCRHLNPYDVYNFRVPAVALRDEELSRLGRAYLDDLVRHSRMLVRRQKQTGRTETQCFRIRKSKPLLDAIDHVLARHYGFSAEELDFVVNYDIKFRLGESDLTTESQRAQRLHRERQKENK
jgi:hypothetical protein